ncbi:hypothetical protein BGZ60DRAFT_534943 [Tricladium varicosporioides]|nr:hypothetical protein BGZ60DRAFT_534943 [Hymenoscyphus varicosporioides]
MHTELHATLDCYRRGRRFDPELYLHAKSALLNAYFSQYGLTGCVVGLSGGVDSAVTLGIIAHAGRQAGSPIRRIQALLLPVHGEGATHQDIATSRGAEAAAAFGVPCATIELSSTLARAREASLAGTGIKGTAWASGQLVSYLRTPIIYYQSALLSEQGFPAVVCGTTNRDEGSYIGFFGKASDGMVDLQPLSDIHKSEVYRLAALLGVPTSIREAVPTGDTYDGACDEEMIGASYDALELYTWYLCNDIKGRGCWLESLCSDARTEFLTSAKKFEHLHRVNTHKYIGDSPAVHLDVYDRIVPGGWRSQELQKVIKPGLREAALAVRVGPVHLNSQVSDTLDSQPCGRATAIPLADLGDSAMVIPGVLNHETCDRFLQNTSHWNWVPADIHGKPIPDSVRVGDWDKRIEIGSYRATAYDEKIAGLLWDRIAPSLPPVRTMGGFTPTDWNGYPVWRPVGINPMLRFIRYEKGGALVPHYDAGFDFGDGKRHTLMSVVITLTPPSQESGGNTRFLLDRQRFLPLDERDYADYPLLSPSRDVLTVAPAKRGDVLVFDHRILHDASIWDGTDSRIIIRTDIIFQRCGGHAINIPSSALSILPSAGWVHDSYYRKAYEIYGDATAIEEAGYFEDGLQNGPASDSTWWSTPLDKIQRALISKEAQDNSRELFVLLSTGAFCPIHAGHLEMMERARSTLKDLGHVVLGGYLAPDHDAYVDFKCGKEAVSAPLRLALCERAVASSDWLMVDRWAALHAPTALNFTTIVERLQRYLAHHVRTHRPIQVAFVFGSDNAGFSKAFVGRGASVCVCRPGYEANLLRVTQDPAVRRNPRVMFAHTQTLPWASTDVRRGNLQGLPEEVKEEWIRLRTLSISSQIQAPEAVSLYVRNEHDWPVQPWIDRQDMDPTLIGSAYQAFVEGLSRALEQTFSRDRERSGGPLVGIVTLDLNNQRKIFQGLIASSSTPIISLDPCLPTASSMAISRCFKPLSRGNPEFIARPGADPLLTQLDCLTHPSYVLFDDDIFSGQTSNFVRHLVETKCRVENFITLCDVNGPLGTEVPPAPRLNLVDCRDFLVGARDAGLVLELPNGLICRAPYSLPYVRPHYHASIPVTEEISFSKRVWELNKIFFEEIGGKLCVQDMSEPFWKLCEFQGFDRGMDMGTLCDWHLNRLK